MNPKEILFIFQSNLVKSLQMAGHASNLKKFPFLPQIVIQEFFGSFVLSLVAVLCNW